MQLAGLALAVVGSSLMSSDRSSKHAVRSLYVCHVRARRQPSTTIMIRAYTQDIDSDNRMFTEAFYPVSETSASSDISQPAVERRCGYQRLGDDRTACPCSQTNLP